VAEKLGVGFREREQVSLNARNARAMSCHLKEDRGKKKVEEEGEIIAMAMAKKHQ